MRQNPPQQQAPTNTQSAQGYMQQGNLPGMWSGSNQPAAYATMLGNNAQTMQGQQNDYTKYMQNLMGQNPITGWKNPYQQQMSQVFQGMQNAPNTQQSAQSWMNQYLPMMQQGGQMNFANPQLQQTQLGQGVQNFMGGNSQANQYANPSLGVGGDIAARIAQMQQPQGSGNPLAGQAANAAFSGYSGLMNQPGMSEAERNQLAQSAFDPLKQQLDRALGQQLSATSASGLGRSSAATKQRSDYTRDLGNAASNITSGLLQQDIGLRNQNRLAGVSGMAGLQGQFTGQDQSQQGLNQNWLMNQGNLGLNLGQLGQQGQLATNQLNQQAGNDAFSQNATRAGMGMDLYNSDANRALQGLEGNRAYDLSTQGMQADNQYRNANMNNSNLMSLLGMGANAGQQDYSNMSTLLQGLLGAGNQNQNAWSTQQGNQLNQMGQQGNLANALYGNQYGAYGDNRNFLEQMRQYNTNRQDQLNAQNQGGGIGGLLGGIGGTLLGSALGPIGAGIGGKIGSSLFGSGGQQQQTTGNGSNPYFNPFRLY